MIDRSFVNKQLRNYASDVILEFDLIQPTANKSQNDTPNKVQIAIIIEHQSTPDKFMAFRMMHYLFSYLFTYLAGISDATIFRQALEENTNIPKSTKGEFMTAAEYYIQQGEMRGEKRGEKRGKAEGKTEVAVNALKKGFDIAFVVDLTGLDTKIVEHLKDELKD